MSSSPVEPADLLDLKLLPSWLKEGERPVNYEHYQGEENRGDRDVFRERRGPRDRGDRRDRDRGPRRPDSRGPGKGPPAGKSQRFGKDRGPDRRDQGRRPPYRPTERTQPPEDLSGRVSVRFVPQPPAFESVVAQMKANPVSYSVFALARLFLEKPERYDVTLTAKPETPFYQVGEDGNISLDREPLEANAFRAAQQEFFKVDVTQGEPIKGNFASVARHRLTGIVLGPTSHHAYQPKLRALYEQRFSRRMSFPEFQRQIEIVNDPAIVEQWKEEARNITTFTTLKEEPPQVFNSSSEAERHFRAAYLPSLVQPVTERTISGVQSRQLRDRLGRYIEMLWAKEIRSPSSFMPELTNRLRESGLQVYRHRKGMLFVSSVRPRPFARGEGRVVSEQVQALLSALEEHRGLQRKDLADKLLAGAAPEEAEAKKLALASDLKWLISEGHVIEFNDGTLDLPRVKKPVEAKAQAAPAETPTTETMPAETPPAELAGEVPQPAVEATEPVTASDVLPPAVPEPEKVIEADPGVADKTSSSLPT